MNTFAVGIIVGFILFAVLMSVWIFIKMQTEITRLATEIENLNKVLRVVAMKTTKIEQMTHSTMHAAETFVDALRESAEHMQMNPRGMNKMDPDSFDDLRQSFEEGIKGMEDGDDENLEEPPEPWK